MLPRQIQQQIGSLAVVSGLAGIILAFAHEGFPMSAHEVAPWLLAVAVWAVVLFVVSGLLPFVWFAATRFQPRRARTGLMLWWLMLVVLAAAVYYLDFDI